MKSPEYQKRFYRDWVYPKNLFRAKIVVGQTDLEIFSDKPVDPAYVKKRVEKYRRQIERYIEKDEKFLTALKPLTVESKAAPIVRAMATSSRKANVGPMAAVAGAIAESVGSDLLRRGSKTVIVENGGDIFLKVSYPVRVGLFAGKSRLLSRLKLKIMPEETPLGICASSGTIGHSLSFGNADCCAIIARNACLADSVATATANLVQTKADLEKAVKFARSIKGVRGLAIIFKDSLASWGKIEFES